MGAYIALMFLGSLIMAFGLGVAAYFTFTRRRAARLLRLIGQSSEDQINADLDRWAKAHRALFLKAALFKYDPDKLFEVDSILITTRAIFVVEIKSISGVITGRAADENWVKIVNEQRFPITNALRQNDRHIRHIQAMLNLKLPLVSLVIYANRAESISVPDVPSHAVVIRHVQLFSTLDYIDQTLSPRLSREQMRSVYKQLKQHQTKKRHDTRRFALITKQGR